MSGDPALASDSLLEPRTPLVVDATTITWVVAAVLAGARAGDSIYMRYGDIQGDIAATGYEGAIELDSFQWGVGRGRARGAR